MTDINATLTTTTITATVSNPADVAASLGVSTISATVTSAGDINASVSEAPVAATLVNGGSISASVTSSPITATLTAGLEDAPSDGTIYGRQNSAWVEVDGVGAILTTRGDLLTRDASAVVRLPLAGAAGSFLTRDATDPVWSGFYFSGTAGQTYTMPSATTVLAGLAIAQTFTRQQFIDGSQDEIQLRVQAHGTQTANLQTWENSSGTILAYINPEGTLALNAINNNTSTSRPSGLAMGSVISVDGTSFSRFGIDGVLRVTGGTKQVIVNNWDCRISSTGTFANAGNYNPVIVGAVYLVRTTGGTQTVNGEIAGAVFDIRLAANTTVTGAAALIAGVEVKTPTLATGATTPRSYGVRIGNQGGTGIISSWGLYLDNQSGSSSDNYAIYTNTGLIRFGDDIVIADAKNIQIQTTTGTKFGTATTQKLGFWNATPIIQPTTGVAAATFAANTSGIANDTATFDGYTIGQVVKALRNAGLLA